MSFEVVGPRWRAALLWFALGAAGCESVHRDIDVRHEPGVGFARVERTREGNKDPRIVSSQRLRTTGFGNAARGATTLELRTQLGSVAFYGEELPLRSDPVFTVRALESVSNIATDVLISFGRQELDTEVWWPKAAELLDTEFRHQLHSTLLSAWARSSDPSPGRVLEQLFLFVDAMSRLCGLEPDEVVAMYARLDSQDDFTLAPWIEALQRDLAADLGSRSARLGALADPKYALAAWKRWEAGDEARRLRERLSEACDMPVHASTDWLKALLKVEPWFGFQSWFDGRTTAVGFSTPWPIDVATGEWNTELQQQQDRDVETRTGPARAFVCAASTPDREWQTQYFGRVCVEGWQLWEWSMLWSALSPDTQQSLAARLSELRGGLGLAEHASRMCAEIEAAATDAERSPLAKLCSKLRVLCGSD
jgi:hypothetical protein